MPKPVYDNVDPRIGVAWRMTPITVLRAGWPWTTPFATPPGTNDIPHVRSWYTIYESGKDSPFGSRDRVEIPVLRAACR
jgi:hypothetical protein